MSEQGVGEALNAALTRIAGVPRLLVACDYDGTVSPIVTDPAAAVPHPRAIPALRALAALPDTAVVLVSGRALADLATISGAPPEVYLVGSHGAEMAAALSLGPELAELRARLSRELAALASGRTGVRLEEKPASVTVHTRTAPRDVADAMVAAVRAGPAGWPGVHVMTGKEVVELSVLPPDKGAAVEALRARFAADGVVFLGDDVTDESVFAVLRDGDVGVKVGTGETRAEHRVADPADAVACLARLVRVRGS